jgi:hypothetical protein
MYDQLRIEPDGTVTLLASEAEVRARWGKIDPSIPLDDDDEEMT